MTRLRNIISIFISLIFIAAALIKFPVFLKSPVQLTPDIKEANKEWFKLINQMPEEGPGFEKWYFDYWHQPYSHRLPQKILNKIWNKLNSMPTEKKFYEPKDGKVQKTSATDGWRLLGPSGLKASFDLPDEVYNSGRILDLEPDDKNSIARIASASGGLWQLNLKDNSFFPLSDNLSSLAVGSFASKPGDSNIIFLGTGEPEVRTGTGLWKTTDGGLTWDSISLPIVPDAFYKIRYQQDSNQKINIASTIGFFNSYDGGKTFNLTLTGDVTDFDTAPNDTNIIYACMKYGGLFKSVNGGLTWNSISIPQVPAADFGRTAVSVYNSNILFTAVSNAGTNSLMGIYKSTDGGNSWIKESVPFNYLEGQAWYDNFISVCPANPDLIIAGGAELIKSTDGGNSWSIIKSNHVHQDNHAIAWSNNGNTIWEGNDGGLTASSDRGNNWSTSLNRLPVTQYVGIGVGKKNPKVIFGGSQDNGLSGTTDGGVTWNQTYIGDGGGITIDKYDASEVYGSDGVFNDGWKFHFVASPDYGQHWHDIYNGIDQSNQWFTTIREYKDQSKTVLYAASGYYVYYSTDNGAYWEKLNPAPFNSSVVGNLTVTPVSPNSTPVVYACIEDVYGVNILKVFDEGKWYERSTGLPADYFVRKVVPDPKDYNTAFTLINGFSSQKIFKTTNRGISWSDITGNLPDVPVADLVVNPLNNNKLYLGSEMGCFETSDAGVTWIRWNNGLPDAAIITEMKFIDSTSINGKFFVVAGTFGRSIWIREAGTDDVTGIVNIASSPDKFELEQNYPNPFNPLTVIQFSIPASGFVQLKVFDISGKEVQTPVNGYLNAGTHKINFAAGNLASGVYLYRLTTASYSKVKKMILLR